MNKEKKEGRYSWTYSTITGGLFLLMIGVSLVIIGVISVKGVSLIKTSMMGGYSSSGYTTGNIKSFPASGASGSMNMDNLSGNGQTGLADLVRNSTGVGTVATAVPRTRQVPEVKLPIQNRPVEHAPAPNPPVFTAANGTCGTANGKSGISSSMSLEESCRHGRPSMIKSSKSIPPKFTWTCTGIDQDIKDAAHCSATGEGKIVASCGKEGEYFSEVYDEHPNSCCEGLTAWPSGMDTRISVVDKCYQTGKLSGNPRGVCINCGDGVCSGNEDICNCSQDCGVEASDYKTVKDFCSSGDYSIEHCTGPNAMDRIYGKLCKLCEDNLVCAAEKRQTGMALTAFSDAPVNSTEFKTGENITFTTSSNKDSKDITTYTWVDTRPGTDSWNGTRCVGVDGVGLYHGPDNSITVGVDKLLEGLGEHRICTSVKHKTEGWAGNCRSMAVVKVIANTITDRFRADVDGNNKVNIIDAVLVLKRNAGYKITDLKKMGWKDTSTTGDVNCDSNVTVVDAVLVLKKSVGYKIQDLKNMGWCVN